MSRRKDQGQRLALARELYEAGSSLEAIAEVLGCKAKTVNCMLSQTGLKRKRSMNDYKDTIIGMRKEGRTLDEIVEVTGFGRPSVCKFLREHGLGKYQTKNIFRAEEDLIDENTVFVKPKKETVERFYIDGKWYVTVPESEIYRS